MYYNLGHVYSLNEIARSNFTICSVPLQCITDRGNCPSVDISKKKSINESRVTNFKLIGSLFIGQRENLKLGILLREIGHWAQWHDLRSRYPTDANQTSIDSINSHYTDFFQARGLVKTRASQMPRKYDEIVEKLIECDFASGDDLSTPELQAAIHQHVGDPLAVLEKEVQEVTCKIRDLDFDI